MGSYCFCSSFTELSKVIYVDSVNGDDTLAGHRISNPKRTIKAAMDDINADANGDGSIVLVGSGIYGETFPIDIQKNDIAVVVHHSVTASFTLLSLLLIKLDTVWIR